MPGVNKAEDIAIPNEHVAYNYSTNQKGEHETCRWEMARL